MTTTTTNTAVLGTPPGAHPAAREEYNYDHFHPQRFLEDAKLMANPVGVVPGDLAPDFELHDTEGNVWHLSSLRGRPVVLITGSATCPMGLRSRNGQNRTRALQGSRHPNGRRIAASNSGCVVRIPTGFLSASAAACTGRA